MCLAIPMQVLTVRDGMARCAAGGVERDVNLFLLHTIHLFPDKFHIDQQHFRPAKQTGIRCAAYRTDQAGGLYRMLRLAGRTPDSQRTGFNMQLSCLRQTTLRRQWKSLLQQAGINSGQGPQPHRHTHHPAGSMLRSNCQHLLQ